MKTQLKNSISALSLQLVTTIIGLIIPQMMIQAYGSELNGLASSITQFLSYVTLLEGGIGGVTRATLYRAFAEKDQKKISGILKTTESFFRKLSAVFIAYVLIVAFVYPVFIDSSFDFWFTGSLICIIAVSTIAQYCFGITYSIFLQADKKNYISNSLNIVTSIGNAILTIILIKVGISFHIVKLVSTLIFVLRPLFLNLYVKRNYEIDKSVKINKELLSQRWNGMAHHIAWFLHTNTDVVIITFLGSLSDVSIYSIYYLVASSMTKITTSCVSGAEALFGNMIASEGEEKAREKFAYYSMFMNLLVVVLFTTAGTMLMPFISLYTKNISDANYYVPLLGYMLLLAEAIYCLRIPYHGIVTAMGHFKQTQNSAIVETSLNIVLSIVLIKMLGLPGVAIATAIAMVYRTVYYIFYLSKYGIRISLSRNLCSVFCAGMIPVLITGLNYCFIPNISNNYYQWIGSACVSFIFSLLMALAYVFVFYKNEFLSTINIVKRKILKVH